MTTIAPTTSVREHPILFSAPMVRAILDGPKTQTRRLIKNPHGADRIIWIGENEGRLWPGRGDEPYVGWAAQVDTLNGLHLPIKCPYGVGDRLWAKENFFVSHGDYDQGGKLPTQLPEWADEMLHYCADGTCCDQIPECCCSEVGKPKNRPSIHMPRWASRITLEITDIRPQRLQEISREDAMAEGIDSDGGDDEHRNRSTLENFRLLWDSLNAKRGFGWATNPWVWAYTFRRLTPC